MEMYIWMILGAIAVGFLAKTYFDVYCAWRAWVNNAPRSEGLVVAPATRQPSLLRRMLDGADRALHAFLMSPTAR
jgi:hypothetical protein